MIFRRHTEEETTVATEAPPEQRIIDSRTRAVAEKVDAAHEALDRFLKEGNTNGAR